jgi:WD40 repeat protein
VALAPDGGHALSGSSDRTLRWWDLETGRCLHVLEGHTDWVMAVALAPDGGHALSGSSDRTLRWWDLAAGRCVALFPCEEPVACVALRWSPAEGRYQAVAGLDDGQVQFFHIEAM